MYHTVFDIAQTKSDYSFVSSLALLTAVGALILVIRTIGSRAFHVSLGGRWALAAGLGLVVLAPIFLVVALMTTNAGLQTSQSELASGRTMVAEGLVQDFHAQPPSGNYPETFTVAGVSFAYSDFDDVPCYHTTLSRGGAIGPDLRVRLHYYTRSSDECIVKVEIG